MKSQLLGFRFQPSMENAFQKKMADMRRQRVKHTAWLAMSIYLSFGFTDPAMLPDAYQQAWLVRALIVSLSLVCFVAAVKLPTIFMRDLASSMVIILGGIGVAWLASLSRHPNAMYYIIGIFLVCLFGNNTLCMRRRNAVTTSAVLLVFYAVFLVKTDTVAPVVRFMIWAMMFSAIALSLVANFQMDRDRRITFLARSREVEMFKRLATEDTLTQLANRRAFDARLALEWRRACREVRELAIIMMDIDQFKCFNDHYGHLVGDQCLRQVAAVLKEIPQRSSDLVARFGGEEFVVMLPNTTAPEAVAMAERMRQSVFAQNIPHLTSHVAPVVSLSLGVYADVPTRFRDPAEWLVNADAALYRAKRNGRNQVVAHDALATTTAQPDCPVE